MEFAIVPGYVLFMKAERPCGGIRSTRHEVGIAVHSSPASELRSLTNGYQIGGRWDPLALELQGLSG